MLTTSAVTFWRWLTGQSFSSEPRSATAPTSERRVWLRHAANLNVQCKQASEESEGGVQAVIRSISRGGLQLIAPRRFEPGSILSVESGSPQDENRLTMLACVVHAQPHGEGEWTMGCRFSSELDTEQLQAFGAARARPQPSDPRGWSRYHCDARAVYQRVNGGDSTNHPARVVNISAGGVALQVDEPVAVGELLSTELHDSAERPIVTILACVVRVQSAAEGQILGCQFIRELAENDLRALL